MNVTYEKYEWKEGTTEWGIVHSVSMHAHCAWCLSLILSLPLSSHLSYLRIKTCNKRLHPSARPWIRHAYKGVCAEDCQNSGSFRSFPYSLPFPPCFDTICADSNKLYLIKRRHIRHIFHSWRHSWIIHDYVDFNVLSRSPARRGVPRGDPKIYNESSLKKRCIGKWFEMPI